ncbi:hypothetical protein GCM10009535_44980 [Streptomyces thermocarboxydovorans]|uniref:TetR family transcriptional regulator n=1 Tax=Streptomyces thermocarboxydovorans TaxID=59298 RepID=A0ABP3SYP6_9ACTN
MLDSPGALLCSVGDPDETADTVGAFYVTLMTGLIAQWSFDPDSAPEGGQLAAGLRRVVEAAGATGGAP